MQVASCCGLLPAGYWCGNIRWIRPRGFRARVRILPGCVYGHGVLPVRESVYRYRVGRLSMCNTQSPWCRGSCIPTVFPRSCIPRWVTQVDSLHPAASHDGISVQLMPWALVSCSLPVGARRPFAMACYDHLRWPCPPYAMDGPTTMCDGSGGELARPAVCWMSSTPCGWSASNSP